MFSEFTYEKDIDSKVLGKRIEEFNRKLDSSVNERIKLMEGFNQLNTYIDKYSEIKSKIYIKPQSLYNNIVSVVVCSFIIIDQEIEKEIEESIKINIQVEMYDFILLLSLQ